MSIKSEKRWKEKGKQNEVLYNLAYQQRVISRAKGSKLCFHSPNTSTPSFFFLFFFFSSSSSSSSYSYSYSSFSLFLALSTLGLSWPTNKRYLISYLLQIKTNSFLLLSCLQIVVQQVALESFSLSNHSLDTINVYM